MEVLRWLLFFAIAVLVPVSAIHALLGRPVSLPSV